MANILDKSLSNPEKFNVASELKVDGVGEDSISGGQEITTLEGTPFTSGQSTIWMTSESSTLEETAVMEEKVVVIL